MIQLCDIINVNEQWPTRIKLMLVLGWSCRPCFSKQPLDNIFWSDNIHTMAYRASYLATLPEDKFCKLVYEHCLAV